MNPNINVRVYGICIQNQRILVLDEMYAGERLIKLPGGGLEFGEGLIDCLHREFEEELNLKIDNIQHFYTQEDFVASRFRENEQLLTIYYKVDIVNIQALNITDPSISQIKWISIQDENPFTLPVDKIVFEKLKIFKF